MDNVVKIDIGASATKYEYNGEINKFPTTLRETKVVRGFELATKSIEYKNKNYIVGKISNKALLSRDFNFFKEYSPIFVYEVLNRLNISDTKNIILNIGFSYIYVNDFKEIVESINCFKVNDKEFCFKDINCFIQGQGIYNSLNLDGTVAIYDIGFHTNDFLMFDEDGELLENESDKNGVVTVATLLKNDLNYKFDLELTEHQANEILQSKQVKLHGDICDVSSIVDELIDNYTQKTISDLKTKHGSKLAVCDSVVISGGGANYFVDMEFPTGTKLICDEYANVKGYC